MAKIERTKNTIYGAIWGTIERGSSILLPFLVRTVLIYKLGMEYLGLSSLFNSILQVLNLTELGFGSAAVYAMYKPIADDDFSTAGSILVFLRKVYRIIGVIIIVLGLLTTPFLHNMVSGSVPSDINVYILYFIYIFDTAISYLLFAHKRSLLSALQLNTIASKVTFFSNTVMRLCQILILLLVPNYYFYIILIPIFTIISNITCSIIVDKDYRCWLVQDELQPDLKKDIKSRLFPLMSSKLALVLVNSADTLVISAFLGLAQVAIYNNYYYIMNSVSAFLVVIYDAMKAGIGNALVVDHNEKITADFNKFCFINNWIVTICTVCLLCLYQPFMLLWVGKNLMLPFGMVILFTINFYARTVQRIVVIYKDAAGIWKEDMFRCYLGCGLNLIVNIVSVRYIGLYGVIGSSVMVNLFIVPWMAHTLYKVVFRQSSKTFYLTEVRDAFLAIFVSFIVFCCVNRFPTGLGWLLIRGIVCFILTNILLWILYHKNIQYKMMVNWIKNLYRKRNLA